MLIKIKKVVSVIITVVTVLMFLMALGILFMGINATKSNKAPSIFGYNYSIVASPSMEPSIMTGDIIVYKNISYSNVNIGDIIVFYFPQDDINVVHRVHDIIDGKIVTKGDNNDFIDPGFVLEENLLGKVSLSIPFKSAGRFVINNRSFIFICLIGIFAMMFITSGFQIITAFKEKKQEDEYNKLKEELLKEIEEDTKKW